MKRFTCVALASALGPIAFLACGGAPPAQKPCPVCPNAPASSQAAASPPSASAAASAGAYSGHGLASVPPEVLAKYRPKPLPPEVARHIQAMFDVAGPGTGALSPDGKSLYFGWRVTGTPQVWTIDGPRHFPTQLTGGSDLTSLVGITPNGARLVIQRDRNGEENPGLYLQDPRGGPLTVVQHTPQVQVQAQATSDDGRWLYYRANDRKPASYAIYRYDLQTGAKETLLDQDGIWNVADLRPDGRMLLAKETGSVSSEIYEWDPKTKQLAPLMGQGEAEEYDVRYGAKDGEVLVLTNKLDEFRRLYAWTAGKMTPVTLAQKHDVQSFAIDRRKTRVLYEVNDDGYTRLFALDARTYRPAPMPQMPDSDHVRVGATTPDARFTTLGIDDGKHPQQAYVLDWQTRTLEKWNAPSAPEIDTTKFARAELQYYPARDGTKIPALVRKPEKCASDPCAVVIHFHGGPEGESRPGFSTTAQLFVDAGFVFVEPNVRGSDGFGKAWFHADDGPKRLAIITDIEDASKWAKQTFASNGKPPKVGIFGGSYGGYSVLMGMTMFAGAYDAGVDIVGISNLTTFLQNTAPYRRILRISEYGDPDKDKEALAKLSPMTYVDRVNAPLLIEQGATDPRVPAGEAIQIHDAVVAKGVPCDLEIFPDEGHGAQKRENRVLMYGHAIAWFQKYLLGT